METTLYCYCSADEKSEDPIQYSAKKSVYVNKRIHLKLHKEYHNSLSVPGKTIRSASLILRGVKNPIIITLASLMISCNPAVLSDARALYVSGEYQAASRVYRDLYRGTPRDQHALRGVISYEMAENYRKLNQSAHAVTAYSNAIRFEYPDTLMYLHYAQMLHREGNYLQASEAYRVFLQIKPGEMMALNGIRGAELAGEWSLNPTRYVVQRMDLINSRHAEFSPMLAHNDGLLYFTSSREDAAGEVKSPVTGMKYNDLYFTSKNSRGEWQKPQRIESEINTVFDEGTPSITPDGDKMYYTFSRVDPDHPTGTEIYHSRRINGVWSAGQPLQIRKGDSISLFAHPAISPSGRYLCFVSDMPGGQGGKDIWRAFITQTGEVMGVENLGPEINSPGNEMFPFMRNDTTLYFSSDGHPGMGGLDLFKATYSSVTGRWQLDNLQSPLNTSADDFGITFTQVGENGFFSSNRDDVRGYDHLYSFSLSMRQILVEGFVVDREDQLIPGASLSVIGNDGSQMQFTSNRKGEYRFTARGGVDYLFMATAEGFLNQKQSLHTSSTVNDTIYYVDFEMTPYNKPVILENIYYDFDRATLRPDSKTELDGLILLLTDHPEIAIQLIAHTDRRGSDAYNRDLSLRRAESVVTYLTSKGIDGARLSAYGEGENKPKSVNSVIASGYDFLNEGDLLTEDFIQMLTPEQQEIADQINRRTEFRVISNIFLTH